MATLLIPRFRTWGSAAKAVPKMSVDRETRECGAAMQVELPAQSQPPPRADPSGQLEDGGFWALLYGHIGAQQLVSITTANTTVEVHRYSNKKKRKEKKKIYITIDAHAMLLNYNLIITV